MKTVIAAISFHFLCIFFFSIIYIYLRKGFINNADKNSNNSFLKKDVKLIDIIMFTTTIQAGVGLTNLLPNTFYLKLFIIIQQFIMICSYVFITLLLYEFYSISLS